MLLLHPLAGFRDRDSQPLDPDQDDSNSTSTVDPSPVQGLDRVINSSQPCLWPQWVGSKPWTPTQGWNLAHPGVPPWHPDGHRPDGIFRALWKDIGRRGSQHWEHGQVPLVGIASEPRRTLAAKILAPGQCTPSGVLLGLHKPGYTDVKAETGCIEVHNLVGRGSPSAGPSLCTSPADSDSFIAI